MNKRSTIMFLLVLIPVFLTAKISIGKFEVLNQVDLHSMKYPGEKGVKVIIDNVTITGYLGKMIALTATIYKDSQLNTPMDTKAFSVDDYTYKIDKAEFIIPNSEIYRYLGKGTHDAYVILSATEYNSLGNAKIVQDFNHFAKVSFTFDKEIKDTFTAEKEYNMGLVKKYAEDSPVFAGLEKICNTYDISMYIDYYTPDDYFTNFAQWKTCDKNDLPKITKFAEFFIPEWKKYPTDLIKSVNLKAVAFVKDLKFYGVVVGGIGNVNAGMLLLNMDFYEYTDMIGYIIHHEFFHYIDFIHSGEAFFSKDSEWAALNTKNFKYLGSGLEMAKSGVETHKIHPQKGFFTTYSMSAQEEDKAEVFAYLMSTYLYKTYTKDLVKQDNILNKKVEHIKKFLKKISPVFTEEYFNKLHQSK